MNEASSFLERIVSAVERQSSSLERLAEHLAPQPTDIVGTPYVRGRLGCSTAWVTQMIKDGRIPEHSRACPTSSVASPGTPRPTS